MGEIAPMQTEMLSRGPEASRSFSSEDGLRIHYEIFGASGASVPVVLHHGFAASTLVNWVMPGVVASLTGAGRRVISLDARGHGRSEKPRDPAFYGEARMARDVVALADRLRLSSYDLVGYSMGAIVSLLVAADDARVRRLVLSGIGAAAVELGGVDTRVLAPSELIRALEAEDPFAIEELAAREFRLFADATSADRPALVAQARAVHATPIPFERIRKPTLVMAGRSDALAARPDVLAAALPGSRLELVAGDHMNALLDPRFAESLVEFLA
jgi:pimeloyl-ACP methyl ester carboxylesterase